METTGRRSGLLACALVITSCIGSNPEIETPTYPDKGRTTVDPVTTGVIGLTFDDGPHAEYTREILEVLAKHQIKATFFNIGIHIAAYREIVEEIAAAGHQIGNHSYYHLAQPSLSEATFKHRTRAVKLNIGDADRGRLYYRFPFGAAGDDQLRWLSELKFGGKSYRVVGWNIDSQDWDFASGDPDNSIAPYPNGQYSAEVQLTLPRCKKDKTPNPFTQDFVGWSQYVVRRSTGGVILFHDIQRITRDHIDEIITGWFHPDRYWSSLTSDKRKRYRDFYECTGVDPDRKFRIEPLYSGIWPSYVDE